MAAPAPAPPSPTAPARGREYALDWLRVIAFAILIGYHAGLYFVRWSWIVQNPRTSFWLEGVLVFFNRWRLPLLFFISGAGTWFNLRRRGASSFVGERLTRLGVPLLFGMFVICPPQVWVQRAVQGEVYPSYLRFWGTVFTDGFYPRGNLSWEHLWFLPYLLTYSLLSLPLLSALRRPAGRAVVDRLAGACERPGVVYLLALPIVAVAVLLEPRWPRNYSLFHDWAAFTSSLLYFLTGFVVGGSERFLALLERRRRELAAVAGALMALDYALLFADLLRWSTALGPAIRVVEASLGMTTVLALVGLARVHLDRDSPALRRANAAVYPFYVVHQTITVLLGWAWLGWDLPIAVKFPLLCAGTFLGSWAVYELVRRTRVTRVLFGMRA